MAAPPGDDDDFHARALASLHRQMSLTNDAAAGGGISAEVTSHARSLVEDDSPKIDLALKGYLSLVAARSAVASDVDVVAAGESAPGSGARCVFTSATGAMHANRCALACARTLLSAINSTTVPIGSPPGARSVEADGETKTGDEAGANMRTKDFAARILWNKLVRQSSAPGDKAKRSKPSKVLGRDSLIVSYPYVRERLRRGVALHGDGASASSPASDDATEPTSSRGGDPLRSMPDALLPPVVPPPGIDVDEWTAFYGEFGNLLPRAHEADGGGSRPETEDDGALLWSNDRGAAELRRRREMRARRAADALASVEGAKADVADALGSSASGEVRG